MFWLDILDLKLYNYYDTQWLITPLFLGIVLNIIAFMPKQHQDIFTYIIFNHRPTPKRGNAKFVTITMEVFVKLQKIQ